MLATSGPVATPTGGGGGDSGIPTIVDGTLGAGKAHVEIIGGRTLSFDAVGIVFSTAGNSVLTFADTVQHYSVNFTLSSTGPSGLSITGPKLITGGAWGEGCRITITRNEPGSLAGDFSCTNVEGADSTAAQTFRIDIKGTFSAAS